MKLAIIPEDSTVIKDGVALQIDFTLIPLPSRVHALQWAGSSGEIEYKNPIEEEAITELPAWASACLTSYDENLPEPEPAPELTPAETIRLERNVLLSSTDWWAASDRTMTAAQTAYRQALRDITSQAGFPHNVTWPTKPE